MRPPSVSILLLAFLVLVTVSCREEAIPKPEGYLSLDYGKANYESQYDCTYRFEQNTEAVFQKGQDCSSRLDYPKLDGAIYLTYRPVNGNLKQLLTDAQKLTYEHVVKADNIAEQPFVNEKSNVYGMLYEVTGDAASQSQFYVTDSVHHFLTGSIYFNARPNYDSILPAAAYLRNDIRHLMETLRWKG